MASTFVAWLFAALIALVTGELLQNGGFESLDHWVCGGSQCSLTTDRHSGQHAVNVTGRRQYYQGPGQYIQVTPGHKYLVSAWVKLLNDHSGQLVDVELAFQYTDGTTDYQRAAIHQHAHTSAGWVHLQGSFSAPSKAVKSTLLYFQSRPEASVNFIVDEASVTDQSGGDDSTTGGGSQRSQSPVGNLLQNPEFESTAHWDCWDIHCTLTSDRHSGQHALKVSGRKQSWQGPSQYVHVTAGQAYHGEVWVKLLNDHSGQSIDFMADIEFTDGSHDYPIIARHANARTAEGWINLQGVFTAPRSNGTLKATARLVKLFDSTCQI